MEELNSIKPYEISLWEDNPHTDDNGNSYFKEEKIAVIGSDKLTAPHRCINPVFTENINGSETLTFTMYTNYFDESQNKWVQNPFSKLLVNERKIKLKYEDKWHDFIIKNVQESSENNTYQYTCDSLPIVELSKNGFSIEFNNELMNNTKTINEFVREVLEGTDWTLPATNEITLQEAQEEPVVELKLKEKISAIKMKKDGEGEESVTIDSGAIIYAAYSSYNPDSDILYFLYVSSGDVEKDESTRVITNAECYYLLNPKWTEDGSALSFATSNGISTEYRGKFFKRKIETEYNDILGRYVNVYESNLGNKVYGYTETEIIEPSVTQNLMTSDNDFLYSVEKDYTGWREFKSSGNETILAFSYPFPIYDSNTKEFSFRNTEGVIEIPTTYLGLGFSGGGYNNSNLVLNTGILDNLQDIIGGFPLGKKYVFRIKYFISNRNPERVTGPVYEYNEDGTPIGGVFDLEDIINNSQHLSLILAKYSTNESGILNPIKNSDIYLEIKGQNLEKETRLNEETGEEEPTGYYSGIGEIKKTISGSDLKLTTQTQGYGLFLYSSYSGSDTIYYAIEEAQFFEYLEDLNGNMVIPGNLDISSNAYTKTTEKYFYPVNEINNVNSVITEDDIEFMSVLPDGYSLSYDTTYEKKRTVTASESNRFNILQSLCETFECWIKFNIEHKDNGEIKTEETPEDDGTKHIRQIKTVSFIDYSSNDIKYPGFTYGINLSSIQRTLNSDKIVSKIIVKDNSNSLAQNGFCTIARAKDNPTGENFFYDFNYYIRQKLISHDEVTNDLYSSPIIYGELNDITPMYDYYSIPPYSEYMEYGVDRRKYFYSNTIFNPNFEDGAQNGKNVLGKDYDGEDARLFGPYCYYTNVHNPEKKDDYRIFYSPVYNFDKEAVNGEKIFLSFYYKLGKNSQTNAQFTIKFFFNNISVKNADGTEYTETITINKSSIDESGKWTLYTTNIARPVDSKTFYYQIINNGPTSGDSGDTVRASIRFTNLNIEDSNDSLCYYKKYKDYNNFNQKLIEKQVETSTAITKVEAEVTYYKEAIDAAVIESENISEELGVLNNNYEVLQLIKQIPENIKNILNQLSSITSIFNTEPEKTPEEIIFSGLSEVTNKFVGLVGNLSSTGASTNGVAGITNNNNSTDSSDENNSTDGSDEIKLQIEETLVKQNQIIFNISMLTEYFNYYSEKLLELKIFYNDVSDVIDYYYNKKQILNNIFYDKYCRYIQEGSWTSNDYIDDDLYYYDAQNVLSSSVSPQASYSINVIDISQLNGYESFNYKIGDHTFVEDTEFFGWLTTYNEDSGFVYTPYKEEVIVSEFSHSLDSPESNKITVQNYKTQFEDLFQRITATTQSLQYASGAYNRAANSVNPDGTFDADLLQNTLLGSAIQIINPDNTSLVWDSDGLKVIDKVNRNNVIKLSSGQISISDDGGSTWTAAITAKGINIGMVTSGIINTDKIYIGNSNDYAFRWDKTGLNAYSKVDMVTNEIRDEEGKVISSTIVPTYNYGKFVRFDSYGIYGYENGTTFVPTNLGEIKSNASFGLTWDGFFLKSKHKDENGNIDTADKGYIEIDSQNDFRVIGVGANSTTIERIKIGLIKKETTLEDTTNYIYGIKISDNEGNSVMETDSNGNLTLTGTITANAGKIGGWNIYENELTSVIKENEQVKAGIVLNAGTSSMYSASYLDSTGRTGWAIIENDAYFNNITLRGSLKCAVLEYAEVQAVGGVLMVRPATSIKRRIRELNNDGTYKDFFKVEITWNDITDTHTETYTTIKIDVENNQFFSARKQAKNLIEPYVYPGDWCKLTTEADRDMIHEDPDGETILYSGINTNLFRCVKTEDKKISETNEEGEEVTTWHHFLYLDVSGLTEEEEQNILGLNFEGLGIVNFGITGDEANTLNGYGVTDEPYSAGIGIGLNSSTNEAMLPKTSLSIFSLEESNYSETSSWKYLKPHIILGKIPNNSDLYGSILAGKYGLYADAANITGGINATYGTIGGWTIDSNNIYTTVEENNKDFTIYLSARGKRHEIPGEAGVTTTAVFFAGDNFLVSPNGTIYASNANITGKINAESGSIGGFSISSNYLLGSRVGISGYGSNTSGIAFWAGSNEPTTGNFKVSFDGELYASNVDITGRINASSGKIGLFEILDNGSLVFNKGTAAEFGLGTWDYTTIYGFNLGMWYGQFGNISGSEDLRINQPPFNIQKSGDNIITHIKNVDIVYGQIGDITIGSTEEDWTDHSFRYYTNNHFIVLDTYLNSFKVGGQNVNTDINGDDFPFIVQGSRIAKFNAVDCTLNMSNCTFLYQYSGALPSENIKIQDNYHKIIIGQDKGMRVGIYSTDKDAKNSIRIRTPREDNTSDDWNIWANYNNNTTWGVRYSGEARFTRVLFGMNTSRGAVAYTGDNGSCFIVPKYDHDIRLYSGDNTSPAAGDFSIRTSSSSKGGYLQGTWRLDGSPIAASSDKNYKNSIKNISNKYEILFNNLKPSLYKYNNGTSNRYHTGFIAQDVENAITLAGLTTQDFAGLVIDKQINENTNQEETQYYLRYEEFIALNTLEIQKLKEKIKILENKISEMQ